MSLDRKPKGVFTIIEADNVERPIFQADWNRICKSRPLVECPARCISHLGKITHS